MTPRWPRLALIVPLEQVNYAGAGRKIELIAEDSEGNPATALAKYQDARVQPRLPAGETVRREETP